MLDTLDDSLRQSLQRTLSAILGVCFFIGAVLVLRHQLQLFNFQQALDAIYAVQGSPLLMALVLTACGYLLFCSFDLLALAYLQRPLPAEKTVVTSFINYAFTNNIGRSMLGVGAMRNRLYTAWGLSIFEITRIVAFCTLTFWLGLVALSGAVLVIDPPPLVISVEHLPFQTLRPVGLVLLAVFGGLVVWLMRREKPLRLRCWEVDVPSPGLICAQVAVAALELMAAAGALYVLLHSHIGFSYGQFLAIYLLALVIGLISHVPGGLGVFEMVIIAALPAVEPAALIGGLVVFRLAYYLVPLVLATLALAFLEWQREESGVRRAASRISDAIRGVTPSVLAAGLFVAGLVLLVTGSLPQVNHRAVLVSSALPLAVIESAHLLGAAAGILLMLITRSLHRRLTAAFLLAGLLLTTGIICIILRGGGFLEAGLLFALLIALMPCRPAFYRASSLLEEDFSARWLVIVTLILGSTIWLGLFAFRSIPFTEQLWVDFGIEAEVSRFLRGSAVAVGVLIVYAVARFLEAERPDLGAANGRQLADATPVVIASDRASANLVYLGEKSLLFAEDNRAFIMYANSGRSWVTMGDPVGPLAEWPDLIWRFSELCDHYEARPVFYQVAHDNLGLYLDLGLTPMRIGEEARIPLADFTLDGSERRELRAAARQLERLGASVSIIDPRGVQQILPALRDISNNWEQARDAGEKNFSLGHFDDDYLRRFPIAVVRLNQRIVAFSNIWKAAPGTELAADLIRCEPTVPEGTIEYLLVQLMLWGKVHGYRSFSLGMAPLTDEDRHTLAPLWSRLGTIVYRHGEHFHTFQGLRRFKEKFAPDWQPRYLALPDSASLSTVLADLTTLISTAAPPKPISH